MAETFSAETLDSLITDAVKSGTPIDGADGLLNELTKAVLERSMAAELTHHLGYENGDPAGRGSGNSRNGSTAKTVNTVNGAVTIDAPRDRNGTFEPVIVPKKVRRLSNINSVVLSLYSRGMTTRDIEAHLEEVYGAKVSRELISNITEVVVDEIKAWQSRPLDEVYPILYIDGLRLRIKDNGVVTTKVAYLAIGVDVDGRKHALGCWIQDTEGAKFWQKVVIDLRNRGVHDILIACCDGLTGLPDAIRSVFPETVVQTCVVHVIRNAMRFVSYKDRKKVASAMREIYTAASVDAAELALKEFDGKFGEQYPGAIDTWRLAWNEFIPFLDYPVELRKIVYTTNTIESINFQLRKITKNRGHFPDKDAAMKLLYLGLRNISSERGGESGTGTQGWKTALNTMSRLFPGRLPLC
ncbi:MULTISPECIES: IS256 family transposase [Mycobacteriaceae]|uniref:IS256 family transposase n=1 Tax=Mycobacteriaceae TaxID=1762 RepID=UPI0029392DE1|nr:IS256 family transposase [Mycobacterium sp. 29Ha]MDV3136836.1 IS256 family transposase [Mycobacterium sp. 29Ha]